MKKLNQLPLFYYSLLFLLLLNVIGFTSCKSKKEISKTTVVSNKKELTEKSRIEFEYLFFDGTREKILGNYEQAEVRFQQALKIDPANAAALYELGSIYTFQNKRNQALLFSKKAALADPKNIWYQLLYAECLKANKQPGETIGVYERLIQYYPERIDLYYELANSYLLSNKPNDALKAYSKIENRIGVTEDASMQKIKIYKSLKNLDKAIEEVKKLITTYPAEGKYYGILGELYQEKGQSDKAFQTYNDLLKIDPTNAYVHLSLADYYRNQKQNDKAFEEIKTAFKNPNLDIDTKIQILVSYYSITENYPELKPDADELCTILIAVHPDEAKAFLIYGDFLYRDNKLELARTQYRKAISLDKEKYSSWHQLLLIESELSDFNAMEQESKEAMDLFPSQVLPYFFNGISNIQLKNYDTAIRSLSLGKEFAYEKALRSQFYASLGDAQNELKKYGASDSSYNKALALDPDNLYVLNNYAYYLSLRKEHLEKAEKMSKRTNELDPNNNSYQDTYGWVLYQMKKYDDAKIWIGKAIENGGKDNGTLLEHYGDVLYQLGDIENALNYWQNAKKAGDTSKFIDKKIADKTLYE